MKKKLDSNQPEKRNLPVPSQKNMLTLSFKKQYIIGVLAVITLVTASMITLERNEKKLALIRKVLRENFLPVCEQYALTALIAQNYPCFECEKGKIFLKIGEVWRYGFAGEGGEQARYPTATYYKDDKWHLTDTDLEYNAQFKGVRWRCLIEEIIKIFDYPDLSEAKAREIKLIRPPGNKQDR